jgi:hypothetical protein
MARQNLEYVYHTNFEWNGSGSLGAITYGQTNGCNKTGGFWNASEIVVRYIP